MEWLNGKDALNAIQNAAEAKRLAMIDSTVRATGEAVKVLVVVRQEEHEGRQGWGIIPVGLLFNQDPFELLNPPEDSITVDPMDKKLN